MAYRNHTPGGCCCDACFSVTDNFCDMDFSIPPEITWGDAPSYGWTNHQCYADGHPGPFLYQGMVPKSSAPLIPGTVNNYKFFLGIYEYDLVLDEGTTATFVPDWDSSAAIGFQVRRTGPNTCKFWLVRRLFRFGIGWSWAAASNEQVFTSASIGERLRVRVWYKAGLGAQGLLLLKVYAAAGIGSTSFTHMLTSNATTPRVSRALICSQYPTMGEEWDAATALDVLQTTAPTAPEQYQNARIRKHRFRWQATSDYGGGSGCPSLDENDYVEGFNATLYYPANLQLTLSGCTHAGFNQVFPMSRVLAPPSRGYETANQNWNNTGTIGAASGDYHVILRQIELNIGSYGDLRFRLWFGVTLGLIFPLPTNGTTNIITAQFDIAAPGANVLQDPRAMSAAYHVTGRPQHADDYTQLIFDSLLGQAATFTLALV